MRYRFVLRHKTISSSSSSSASSSNASAQTGRGQEEVEEQEDDEAAREALLLSCTSCSAASSSVEEKSCGEGALGLGRLRSDRARDSMASSRPSRCGMKSNRGGFRIRGIKGAKRGRKGTDLRKGMKGGCGAVRCLADQCNGRR